ncbi:MAG: hypothetical protein JO323_00215 [Acidobacteriia bacterium]|nr:hypothetical protein [Terriglobia bacterium]
MQTKKPISEKQLAANRRNAQKSTGPVTPAGKARSAQNSRKHGFTAASFSVIRLEDAQELENLVADLVAAYQPVNSQEHFAIERIALAQQSMLRAARLEAGLFTSCLSDAMNTDGTPIFLMSAEIAGGVDIAVQQNRNYCLSEGLTRMARQSNTFSLFLRYQAQAERQYRRAVEDFERLRAQITSTDQPPAQQQKAQPSPHPHPAGPSPQSPEPIRPVALNPAPSGNIPTARAVRPGPHPTKPRIQT